MLLVLRSLLLLLLRLLPLLLRMFPQGSLLRRFPVECGRRRHVPIVHGRNR